MDEWIDAFDLPLSDHLKRSQPIGLFHGQWSWRDVGERIAYRYFCWRCLSLLCLSNDYCEANRGCIAGSRKPPASAKQPLMSALHPPWWVWYCKRACGRPSPEYSWHVQAGHLE